LALHDIEWQLGRYNDCMMTMISSALVSFV